MARKQILEDMGYEFTILVPSVQYVCVCSVSIVLDIAVHYKYLFGFLA